MVRTITHTSWENYIAKKYLLLLKTLDITRNATIVEIAPGTMATIGISLQQYSFNGTLYVIEPVAELLKNIIDRYSMLLPNAKIIGINLCLADIIKEKSLKNIDLLISNHPLDDCIIGKFLEKINGMVEINGFENFFLNHRKAHIKQVKKTAGLWEQFVNYEHKIKIINNVLFEWLSMIKKSQASIISAYDSYFFTHYSKKYPILKYPDLYAQMLLNEIKKKLYRHKLLPKHTKWLCATRS